MAKSKSGNPILDQLTLIEARLAQLEKAKKSIKASDISDKNFLGERYYKELNINRKALGIEAHWTDGLTGKKVNNVNTLYEALQKRRSMLKSALGQRYLEVGKTNPILSEFKVKGIKSGETRGLNPLWLQEYDSDHKVEDNVPDTKKKNNNNKNGDLSINKIGLTKKDTDTNYKAEEVSKNLEKNKASLKEKSPLGLEEKLAWAVKKVPGSTLTRTGSVGGKNSIANNRARLLLRNQYG